jgi:hypothetical protein
MTGLQILEQQLAEMFGTTTRDRVKADPHKHRKVTFTDIGRDSRRYRQYVNGKGQRIRFYRACHRNIAGYFIIWRETVMKNGTIKNDMIRAFKSKAAAKRANDQRHAKATTK